MAELYRDARIYPIWEGTNYIQAMDLVGRKMTMKKGQVFADWIKHILSFLEANSDNPDFAGNSTDEKAQLQFDEILTS